MTFTLDDLSNVETKLLIECAFCKEMFYMYKRRIKNNIKKGHKNYCSKECRGKQRTRDASLPERIEKLKRQTINRFWKRVIKETEENDCWGWSGQINSINGYAHFSVKDKPYRAHRFSYEIHKGEITEGLVVRHTCHNKSCCNPNHLILGTSQDNSNDMKNAERQARGSKNSKAKMNEELAAKIKFMYFMQGKRQCEIFKELGISKTMVQTTVSGKCWNHVPIPNYI